MTVLLLLLLSRFSCVRLCATPQRAAYQAPRPWDSPGKNTGVGCHFLLQCMKVKSESEVAQSCPILSDPMDCSLPGSFVHTISRQEYWSGVPLPSPMTVLSQLKKDIFLLGCIPKSIFQSPFLYLIILFYWLKKILLKIKNSKVKISNFEVC